MGRYSCALVALVSMLAAGCGQRSDLVVDKKQAVSAPDWGYVYSDPNVGWPARQTRYESTIRLSESLITLGFVGEPGAEETRLMLTKVNKATGDVLWSQHIGPSEDVEGDLELRRRFAETFNPGHPLLQKVYKIRRFHLVEAAQPGKFYVVATALTNNGQVGTWVALYRDDGQQEWGRVFWADGPFGNVFVGDAVLTRGGNLLLVGGNIDNPGDDSRGVFVATIASNGTVLGQRVITCTCTGALIPQYGNAVARGVTKTYGVVEATLYLISAVRHSRESMLINLIIPAEHEGLLWDDGGEEYNAAGNDIFNPHDIVHRGGNEFIILGDLNNTQIAINQVTSDPTTNTIIPGWSRLKLLAGRQIAGAVLEHDHQPNLLHVTGRGSDDRSFTMMFNLSSLTLARFLETQRVELFPASRWFGATPTPDGLAIVGEMSDYRGHVEGLVMTLDRGATTLPPQLACVAMPSGLDMTGYQLDYTYKETNNLSIDVDWSTVPMRELRALVKRAPCEE